MSDRAVSNISLKSYTCVDLLGTNSLWDKEIEVWELDFVFLGLIFPIWNSAAQLEGSMLENNSKVAAGHPRPWIFRLAGVCLLSTFHFCLLKIWLTGPASRETPFSFDKGPARQDGKGHSKVAESAYPLQHHKARCGVLCVTENMAWLWFLSFGS